MRLDICDKMWVGLCGTSKSCAKNRYLSTVAAHRSTVSFSSTLLDDLVLRVPYARASSPYRSANICAEVFYNLGSYQVQLLSHDAVTVCDDDHTIQACE